jgi:hypothetical protein
MTAHERSTPASRHLCDLLVTRLQKEVGDVTRKEAKDVCSIGVTTRFAFFYHRRDRLRIYLHVKEAEGDQLTALAPANGSFDIMKRGSMRSSYAKLTPYYLDVDSEEGAIGAMPLLSFAAAQIKRQARSSAYLFPSELSAREMTEGARMTVQVSRIERDPGARKHCIRIFGSVRHVCGFDFARTYGEMGSGFIHVHHLNPLAASKGRRKVNPHTDLRPVCPNCHEMLHRRVPPFTIEELKAAITVTRS